MFAITTLLKNKKFSQTPLVFIYPGILLKGSVSARLNHPRRYLAVLALIAGTLFLSSASLAQTFKAVPLDCGGWFSGFAQADNGRLYGYGDVFGAWRSDDGGSNWSYLNWNIAGGDIYGCGMAVQKDNADVVYYSTDKGLWKSTNGGTSWTALLSDIGIDNNNGAPRFRGASPILIRSNNANEIWFAGPRKGQSGWLWRSADGGSNWAKVGGTTFNTNQVQTLHNVATYANQIWVGSTNGLYVSTNGGTSFSLVGNSSRLADVGMISRFTTGTFAGVGLVARSNNGGGGVSRITATDYNNSATYTITDAATSGLYFGYPTGLQIFSDGSSSAWNTSADRHGFSPAGDGGQTFTLRATTLNTLVVPLWSTASEMTAANHPDYGSDQVIEAVGNPSKWIITGGKAPMYTLDKGLSWQYFPNGNGIAGVKTWLASVSRYDANRIYIPAADIGSAIVTDGGTSGQATLSTRKSYIDKLHSTFRILEGPNTQNLVLAGVEQNTNANLILKSANGGSTWSVLNLTGTGLPTCIEGITKSVMSITDANDFMVVLGEDGSTGQRVYRTTNGGTSFTGVLGLPGNSPTGFRYNPQSSFIERDASVANVRYFVARGQDLYKSTNSGANWSVVTHPFGTGTWVWGLVADPIRSNNLWAAGDNSGVKVSRDGGQTWNSTAQSFNARYVSSCDGKIAVFGSLAGDTQPRLYYSNDDGASFTAQTDATNNFHAVQGITVDRNGKIWVSWNSCTVVTPVGSTQNVAVTGVTISPATASVATAATTTLTATVAPGNATNQIVSWSSSNTAIATVSASGVVTGVAPGTATITVTTQDGNRTATCSVTVTAPISYPFVTSSAASDWGEPASGAYDLNNTTHWSQPTTSGWWQVQLANAAIFNAYTIKGSNDMVNRNLRDWTIQGSNNGTTWTTLNTQSAQTWTSFGETKNYSFSNAIAYSYYRLNFTANNGNTYTQVAEITFSFDGSSTGTGYYWRNMTSITSNSTRTAAPGVNDNNFTNDVMVPDNSNANQWQGAGMTWSTAKANITRVEYYSGIQPDNGCFTAGIQLQYSTNGTSWTNASGWSISPAYPYNLTASNQVYTFTGPALPNSRGVRVVGQVRTNDISWAIYVKEVRVFNTSNVLQRVASNTQSFNNSISPVTVYPNPVTNGTFMIAMDATFINKNITVILTDLTGKRVLTKRFISNGVNQHIDVTKLTTGVYIMNLINEKLTSVKKIVIGSSVQ